ncbi:MULTISPECIES: DUF63 family protein [Halolamina]|uniref:Uncharacterized membrane protein n=1 Tax=Halolamina pelagica TaxID=699431 RepID=A0A1I5THK1_9EURY|nr:MULTISPECIES: DUF63 family protein [Halolamina]NHX37350.1 DUF63 family protein [Halolamina sp. R1-12]SFP82398.1 Uncharacterized membrane protein [Halolamina pelagica]
MVLPAGFALPPLPYLLALLLAGGAVVAALWRRDPSVPDRLVLALVPWMLAGAWLHVLHVVGAAPDWIDPLLGTPAAYLTTAILAGAVWLAVDARDVATERAFAAAGTGVAALVLAVGIQWGVAEGTFSPAWPAVAAVLGVVVGIAVWRGLRRAYPGVGDAGAAGALAVTAHSLDGISTAIGIDVLGATERTPLSRTIIEFGATLPTADLLGSAWLFVLVKLALGAGITALLAESVREVPRQGRLLLVFVAAVGLGPAAHNLLLFSIMG